MLSKKGKIRVRYSEGMKYLVDLLVNKELEKYNLKVEDIENNPQWFWDYTFDSPQEVEEFENYAFDILVNHTTPAMSKRNAKIWLDFFMLNFGLKKNF